MDKYTEIEKFYDLKERGIISEEEFKREKERILKPEKVETLNINAPLGTNDNLALQEDDSTL